MRFAYIACIAYKTALLWDWDRYYRLSSRAVLLYIEPIDIIINELGSNAPYPDLDSPRDDFNRIA